LCESGPRVIGRPGLALSNGAKATALQKYGDLASKALRTRVSVSPPAQVTLRRAQQSFLAHTAGKPSSQGSGILNPKNQGSRGRLAQLASALFKQPRVGALAEPYFGEALAVANDEWR
jgi:hypothetical protein